MPELPEVHTVVEDLRKAGLVGRRITGATVDWERSIGGNRSVFTATVVGRFIREIRRRGKYIVLPLGPAGTILAHLRMSGRLYLVDSAEPRTGYERVTLTLDPPSELRFYDPRKFGRFIYTENPEETLQRVGVEPLSPTFTAEAFHAIAAGRRRMVKPLLLDQHVIAGLGNIYADEALWAAQIHPRRRSDTLNRDEAYSLHGAIRAVLRRGISNLGTQLGSGKSNFVLPRNHDGRARNQESLSVFQRTGLPCPRCATPIERIIVGQRSSHVCPVCQREQPTRSPE